MKKSLKLVSVILLLCLSLSLFAACGNDDGDSDDKGKTVDQVTAAFEAAGYTVNSQTIMNISALVAYKGTDTLTVLFYDSADLAEAAKSTWDLSAQTSGYTCKQDKSNLYFGTAAAIAVYEAA